MGGSSSKVNIDNQVLNQSIMEFTDTNQTKSETDVITYQDISMKDAKYPGCILEVKQTGDIKTKTIQKFNNDSSADLITHIMTNIEDQMKNHLDTKSGFLSTPAGTKATSDIKKDIKNQLTVNFSVDNLNDLVSKVNAGQTLDIDNIVVDPCGLAILPDASEDLKAHLIDSCKPPPVCKIDQDLTVAMFSEQVGNNVVKLLSQDENVQKFVNKVDQSAKSVSTGPIQEIGNAIAKGFGSIWLPFIIAAVIILVALIFWFIKSGEKPTNVAKVAATVAVPEVAIARKI